MFSKFTTGLASLVAVSAVSAIPTQRVAIKARDTVCNYGTVGQGIIAPVNGSTITQINNGSCTDFNVFYCSSQYDKTHSVSVDVLLGDGELLAHDQTPTDGAGESGFSGYDLTVSICPADGDYLTGEQTLSIFETETGYYNPYNYEITSVDVNFVVESS